MTTIELNEIGRWFYESTFYESFWGKISWGSKMKNRAGNCNSNGQIVLNKNYYLLYGREKTLLVLKHELAHLHCFHKIGSHDDKNIEFRKDLSLLGGVITAEKLPKELFVYECPVCKKKWFFVNKLDKKMFCKSCLKENKSLKIIEKRKLY